MTACATKYLALSLHLMVQVPPLQPAHTNVLHGALLLLLLLLLLAYHLAVHVKPASIAAIMLQQTV